MFPVSYFSSCLAWTNGSLPSTLDHFTEYEHWQCIGIYQVLHWRMGATFESCGELKMMDFVHHSILEVDSIVLMIGTCHGGGI